MALLSHILQNPFWEKVDTQEIDYNLFFTRNYQKPRDGPGQVTCRMTVDGQHGTESVVTFLATAKCASSASTGTQLVWITDWRLPDQKWWHVLAKRESPSNCIRRLVQFATKRINWLVRNAREGVTKPRKRVHVLDLVAQCATQLFVRGVGQHSWRQNTT